MKKRKLKGFVLPTLYVMIVGALFISIILLGETLKLSPGYNDDMSVSEVKDDVIPVISESEEVIVKPYEAEGVSVSKSYYDMKDDEARQQQSLVYYENTYLQNSGVLYTSDSSFDVLSVYNGTVTNIDSDEILGNVVEITHNNNWITIYYSLSEVSVSLNDEVASKTVIGKSGDNRLENEKDNCLLFEVYYNGKSLNPEEFYNMDIKDLQ